MWEALACIRSALAKKYFCHRSVPIVFSQVPTYDWLFQRHTAGECNDHYLKCPNMHQHPCHESLPISLWLNHILTALEEKKSMGAGMKVLWIQDTAISTEKMSADDSEWLLCVKIAHHWTAGPQQMQRHKSRWNQVVFFFTWRQTRPNSSCLPETCTCQTWMRPMRTVTAGVLSALSTLMSI